MKTQNFSCSFTANITAEHAFDCINKVSSWWSTNCIGDTTHLNGQFTVRFGKTFSILRVTEFVYGKRIVWKVEDSFLPLFKNEKQWNDTSIAWEISSENNLTIVDMTHIGLTPDVECYADCNKGWSFYVKESLQKLIVEEKGLPGTGIFARFNTEGRKYKGLLFFKNDPLPGYDSDFLFADVKETNGEEVLSFYSADVYDKATFDVDKLEGDYFMLIENKPVYNIDPLSDILQTINKTTMETKNYHATITVHATPKETFEAITHVRDWWAMTLEGESEKLNDVFTVHFGDTFVTFKITEAIPSKKITWLVTDSYLPWLNDKTEWTNTSIVFEIAKQSDATIVDMTHVGLTPEVECYNECEQGWDFYIKQSLFKFIDTGKGAPNTPRAMREEKV